MSQLKPISDKLAHREFGVGRPVVLLHSSASSGSQWTALAEELGECRHVIVPDLIGYGRSLERGPDANSSLDQEAEAVFALIEPLGEPVDLVGHSFGGAVAVKIALRWPEWVRSLTVIEPVLFHLLRRDNAEDRSLLWQIKLLSSEVVSSILSRRPEQGMQQFVDFWNGAGAWERLPVAQRDGLTRRLGQVQNNFAAVTGESWPIDRCRKIACPVLAITGEQSAAAARRVTELLVSALPDVSLRTIDGAGHMAPLSHRAVVNSLIADHLDTIDRTASLAPAA